MELPVTQKVWSSISRPGGLANLTPDCANPPAAQPISHQLQDTVCAALHKVLPQLEGDREVLLQLADRLANVPTPAGPTPCADRHRIQLHLTHVSPKQSCWNRFRRSSIPFTYEHFARMLEP